MKFSICFLVFCLNYISLSAQYNGEWKGQAVSTDETFDVQLKLSLNKNKINGVLVKPEILKLRERILNDSLLEVMSDNQNFYYRGRLTRNLNKMSGMLVYKNRTHPLDLFRGDKELYRPQLPQKPYPYYTEEITYTNKIDSVFVSGTLTIPDTVGVYPLVILIGGSAPFNRDYDSDVFHKRFLVLADNLTKKGFAVFRFDARGVGKSTGCFYNSTSDDFAEDVLSGVNFLSSKRYINRHSVGLIGHSGGGIVASIAASRSKNISYVVLLGSPGLRLKEVFNVQTDLKHKAGEISDKKYIVSQIIYNKCDELIEKNVKSENIMDSIQYLMRNTHRKLFSDMDKFSEKVTLSAVKDYTSIHNRFDLKCDPSRYLKKLTCPVLSIFGSKDLNVPAKENLAAVRKILMESNNTDFKILELEGMNHVFQECKSGTVDESENLEETISPKVMNIITDWMLVHYKKTVPAQTNLMEIKIQ